MPGQWRSQEYERPRICGCLVADIVEMHSGKQKERCLKAMTFRSVARAIRFPSAATNVIKMRRSGTMPTAETCHQRTRFVAFIRASCRFRGIRLNAIAALTNSTALQKCQLGDSIWLRAAGKLPWLRRQPTASGTH